MKIRNKIKTNWNITTRFLVTLIFIVIIELFINLLFWNQIILYTKENFTAPTPEKFTLNFSKYMAFKNGIPFVKEEGIRQIQENNVWIQIVDENFREVYSFKKPSTVPVKYIPIKFAHIYKYDIANSSIFIGEKKYGSRNFSYIIGFPLNRVAKHTLVFNPSSLRSFFWNGVLLLLGMDILVAVIISYFVFGKKMGKPLQNIVNGIDELSKGAYGTNYQEKGVYKGVFSNLNNLGKTLGENKKKREELDKIRSTWISSISHDLKTPLSSIKGYAEIMKDPDYTFSKDEIQQYSEIIYNKSTYIQSLIQDLNLTYKLKNKAIPLKKEEANMTLLLQNTIIEILNNPLYSNKNVNFYPENENIKAFVDKKFLRRALINLILNAIIHNKDNVQIDISIYKKDKIHITIKDNGRGIPEKDLNYVFERYYRGTNTSSSTEGSGLGMAISKQIIDAQGGSINIESTLGEGTTISIIL
ncbi:MAG: HAMP domain-containing histidine kinase [Clostridium sp.]|jgi:signal transduction histidine kinase|uniref:HAMP domain-containing sensor histidine kinase n=1 Tax=Clostridium sp. TaxID=1506 RepID=UPI0025BF7C62|nr:HAMP domain-containing sensor histidine kinase [Clostridium sp.]MCH3963272.1 HAMP domain-containing histidine kinase [Clostridium sp.]MCI1717343.1 HAMP domain-containing histidine kinase [Clostridium sp.]MCI1801683.1 HAMP domain-containing histidine kinase [Clostridium sp.]MCI1815529.1 HAMP domain-containing histidine kinase [Clostridium sp.]MCI1872432.1 HAMP domain-containing histidine kinase [Clostridium sp.]